MDTGEDIIAADDQKVHYCKTNVISSYMHVIWIGVFSANLNLDIEEGW